jgi:hypothetical protein
MQKLHRNAGVIVKACDMVISYKIAFLIRRDNINISSVLLSVLFIVH